MTRTRCLHPVGVSCNFGTLTRNVNEQLFTGKEKATQRCATKYATRVTHIESEEHENSNMSFS